jgi:DtxR family Mn-dependent transcriptional regulator
MAKGRLSENVEMYLETIYVLTEGGAVARTKDIASEWKVSQPSATEMVQKLAAAGFLHYEPYKGASLTPEGQAIGRGVIRKHRLLERFLVDVVGVPRESAEEPACAMEHAIPPEMERWVCGLLGHPARSVDGEPIPPGPCCPAVGERQPLSADPPQRDL